MTDAAKPPLPDPACPGCTERDATIHYLADCVAAALMADVCSKPEAGIVDLSSPATPAEAVALINALSQLGKPAEAQRLALAIFKAIENDPATVSSLVLALATILDHLAAHYGETPTGEKVQ